MIKSFSQLREGDRFRRHPAEDWDKIMTVTVPPQYDVEGDLYVEVAEEPYKFWAHPDAGVEIMPAQQLRQAPASPPSESIRRWAITTATAAPSSNSANRRAVILAAGLLGRRDVNGRDVAPLVGLSATTCLRYLRDSLPGTERTRYGVRITA